MSAEAIANWWLASIIAEGLGACIFLGLAIWMFCTAGAKSDKDSEREFNRLARKAADREN